MIITIDGPAGAGKSTTARELAKSLGIAFLDTGATYRAATLKALKTGINLQDEQALLHVTEKVDIKLQPRENGTKVLLDAEDVSEEIRSEEVSANSHYIAACPAVRNVLVALQRKIGSELGNFVSEGRDQGSVVFPDADVKFYLVAAPEIRARRRYDELLSRNQSADLQKVLAGINRRDNRDTSRSIAPLIKPKGAVEIDTSGKTVRQVVDEMLGYIRNQK